MRDMAVGDEAQFFLRDVGDFPRNALRIAPFQARFGQLAQMLVSGLGLRHRLARIALAEFRLQGESDPARKAQGFFHRFRTTREQSRCMFSGGFR